MITPLKLITS